MKRLASFLLVACGWFGMSVNAAPVPSTVGDNLTAYNNGMGAINNNQWNAMINARGGAGQGTSGATADFGNCNALIMRCASPKCSGGGCASMDVAVPIVTGCVNSSKECKKHGNDLVQYIAAQLVSDSVADAQASGAAAAQAAAANATAQSNAQIAAMQQQMQQMAEQNAVAQQQLQEALAQQQALTQQAIADAVASQPVQQVSYNYSDDDNGGSASSDAADGLTTVQKIAVQSGVSEELLVRYQISGDILTQIENAEDSLKRVKAVMQSAFEYAGCDERGSNCAGPKRVKTFKNKANQFFDPYYDVLDQLYDGLILAQSVGVDLSQIYFLLNDSCNQWAYYMCNSGQLVQGAGSIWPRYSKASCVGGKSVRGQSDQDGVTTVRGGQECTEGEVIPPLDDTSCTMYKVIKTTDEESVKRGYLFAEEGEDDARIRVGCASDALQNSWLFKSRKGTNKARMDIETLERILAQDAPERGQKSLRGNWGGVDTRTTQLGYCALTDKGYEELQKYVTLNTLPKRNICLTESAWNRKMDDSYVGMSSWESLNELAEAECSTRKNAKYSKILHRCFCASGNSANCDENADGKAVVTNSEALMQKAVERRCNDYGAKKNQNITDYDNYEICNCGALKIEENIASCKSTFGWPEDNDTSGTGATPKQLCDLAKGKFINGVCYCGVKELSSGWWCSDGIPTNLPPVTVYADKKQ